MICGRLINDAMPGNAGATFWNMQLGLYETNSSILFNDFVAANVYPQVDAEFYENMIVDESSANDGLHYDSSNEAEVVKIDPSQYIISQLQTELAKSKRRSTYLLKRNRVLRSENLSLKKKESKRLQRYRKSHF